MTVGYRDTPKPLKSSVELLAEAVEHQRLEIKRLFERLRKLEEKAYGQAD